MVSSSVIFFTALSISSAATFVYDRQSIRSGVVLFPFLSVPLSKIFFILWEIVKVFPVPAPAITRYFPLMFSIHRNFSSAIFSG